MTALDPAIISRCVGTLYEQRGLLTPLEYILNFPDAPLQVRGALLAVALESLTDHIQQLVS